MGSLKTTETGPRSLSPFKSNAPFTPYKPCKRTTKGKLPNNLNSCVTRNLTLEGLMCPCTRHIRLIGADCCALCSCWRQTDLLPMRHNRQCGVVSEEQASPHYGSFLSRYLWLLRLLQMCLMRLIPQMRTLQRKHINSLLYSLLNETHHLLETEIEAHQAAPATPTAVSYFPEGLFLG